MTLPDLLAFEAACARPRTPLGVSLAVATRDPALAGPCGVALAARLYPGRRFSGRILHVEPIDPPAWAARRDLAWSEVVIEEMP